MTNVGFFARSFCQKDLEKYGLQFNVLQANVSYSERSGTLRGLHYQINPCTEIKLIRCTRGKTWNVMLDLRRGSNTFGQSFGTDLSDENHRALLVPTGCAHGMITLKDHSEVSYMVSAYYEPRLERGIRWDEARFEIKWPIRPVVISERDLSHPDFDA
jgi:dTDP-4-dehydrorhamnose 3,5-epimerase